MRAPGLLSAAALSVAVLTACDGDATEPPFLPEESPTATVETAATAGPTATADPTPTLTPTTALTPSPTLEPADLEGFREFALQVDAAVEARDVDFFMDVAVISTAACGAPGYLPSLLCEELPPGTVIEGVWTGLWLSEGFLATEEQFRESLQEYFAALRDPTLYAIAALDHYVGGLIGGPAVFAIIASRDDPDNTTRVFEFVQENGAFRMPNVIVGTNLAASWLSGECGFCYDRWERWEGTP